jgi:single-stranded DNA-binding protein
MRVGKNGPFDKWEWIRCKAWNEKADSIGALSEGTMLAISGKWEGDSYEDKNGQKKNVVTVNVSTMTILNPVGKGMEGTRFDDEDIPF